MDVATNEGDICGWGDYGIDAMLPVLILSLIFGAGFCLGYAARAWRSRRRRVRRSLYAPYTSRPHSQTYGHAHRAF